MFSAARDAARRKYEEVAAASRRRSFVASSSKTNDDQDHGYRAMTDLSESNSSIQSPAPPIANQRSSRFKQMSRTVFSSESSPSSGAEGRSLPATRYSVEFLSNSLGLTLEKIIFQTRGACVISIDLKETQSRAGLARDIKMGDALISVNGKSLVLPSIDQIIRTISEASSPRTVVFERMPANCTGFARLVRRGHSGLARFLDFCLHKSALTRSRHRNNRHFHLLYATIFYIEGLYFRTMQDPDERYRYAKIVWEKFLSHTALLSIDSTILIPEELRANISEILGLVNSKLLLEVPVDCFDEALAGAASYICLELPAFCKSTQFDELKAKHPPLKLSLRDHILASRRGIHCFLAYCLQTREHAALLCYLDACAVQNSRKVDGNIDEKFNHQMQSFMKKYEGSDPLLAVPFNTNISEIGLQKVKQNALRFLEKGVAQRFLVSPLCARLVGPADSNSDLSNLVESSHLAFGIEFYRRPVGTKMTESLQEAEAQVEGGTTLGSSGKDEHVVTGDLLGLGSKSSPLIPTEEGSLNYDETRLQHVNSSSNRIPPHPPALMKESESAKIDALVIFEVDAETGKVKVVETVLADSGGSPPSVSAFFIPHGIKSDLDFQELNTESKRSRRSSSGSIQLVHSDVTSNRCASHMETVADDLQAHNDSFPGAFAYNLLFSPPGGTKGKSWSVAVMVNPRERSEAAGVFVCAGLALFSQQACATGMRKRLARFAAQVRLKNRTSDSSNIVSQIRRGNPLAAEHRISLLAPIAPFKSNEDERMFLQMTCESLRPEILLELVLCALLERKILFISKSYSLLTAAVASLKLLIRPLCWQHLCIPVLPRDMIDTLECPTPFIIGVNSVYAFKRDFPFVLDLVVVDLDAGTIQTQQANADIEQGDEEDSALIAVKEAIHSPPSKLQKQLLFDLRIAIRPSSSSCDDILWPLCSEDLDALTSLKQLFSTFILKLLEGVEHCSFAIANEAESLAIFDKELYISHHADDERIFLRGISVTAAFSRYVADTAPRAHQLSL